MVVFKRSVLLAFDNVRETERKLKSYHISAFIFPETEVLDRHMSKSVHVALGFRFS